MTIQENYLNNLEKFNSDLNKIADITKNGLNSRIQYTVFEHHLSQITISLFDTNRIKNKTEILNWPNCLKIAKTITLIEKKLFKMESICLENNRFEWRQFHCIFLCANKRYENLLYVYKKFIEPILIENSSKNLYYFIDALKNSSVGSFYCRSFPKKFILFDKLLQTKHAEFLEFFIDLPEISSLILERFQALLLKYSFSEITIQQMMKNPQIFEYAKSIIFLDLKKLLNNASLNAILSHPTPFNLAQSFDISQSFNLSEIDPHYLNILSSHSNPRNIAITFQKMKKMGITSRIFYHSTLRILDLNALNDTLDSIYNNFFIKNSKVINGKLHINNALIANAISHHLKSSSTHQNNP